MLACFVPIHALLACGSHALRVPVTIVLTSKRRFTALRTRPIRPTTLIPLIRTRRHRTRARSTRRTRSRTRWRWSPTRSTRRRSRRAILRTRAAISKGRTALPRWTGPAYTANAGTELAVLGPGTAVFVGGAAEAWGAGGCCAGA